MITFLTAYNRVQMAAQLAIGTTVLLFALGALPLSYVLISILLSQLLAVTEVYQAARGISPSNPITSGIQVAARIGIGLVLFLHQQVGDVWVILILGVTWALADGTRCLYYLYKRNPHIAWARYHFFLVLYPLGMTLENVVVWQVLQDALSNPLGAYAPFFVIYVLLAIKMYRHMLHQRQRFLAT